MSKAEIEARWPNLEVFGPQWVRVLGMTSSRRAKLTRMKLTKVPRNLNMKRKHNAVRALQKAA
jgi:hypothetical protein